MRVISSQGFAMGQNGANLDDITDLGLGHFIRKYGRASSQILADNL